MSVSMGPSTSGPIHRSEADTESGWLIGGGILLAVMSLLCFFAPQFGSVSVTALIGFGLLVGGLVMVAASILGREPGVLWGGVVLGSILAIAGFLLWTDLLKGTATLTAIVIVWLIVDGAVGIVVNLFQRAPGWGLSLLGSVLALVLGLLLWADWPSTAEWVLGVYAGLVLLLRGLSLIAAGMVLRRIDA